ncbi:hypothetical protein AXG93_3507s1280 [Marchantia polymorpha subsp. ruderalis]|uniref:DRBM domain-containing protein n=1 Tax=Marchantia polymorpha subsp. ruderalis TaxID=1480154 RepID=A0A176VHI6_MARPO|nr:hypothetical protein AXG93_3507s1280 [Marchantia polymorpha subsp. ruderalis]
MRRARAGQTKEQRFVSVLFRGPWRIDRRTSIRRRRGRRRNADGSGLAARASFDNIASACSSSRALVEIARERGPEKLGFSRRAAASDSEVGAIALRFSEHFLVLEVIRSFSVSLLRSLRSLRSSLSSSSSSSIVMTGDEIPLAPPSPPLAGQQPATIAPATAQTPPPPPPLPPDDDTPWDLSHTTPAAFTHILKAAFTDGKERAAKKFQALRMLVTSSLPSAPPPGPATFTVKCLETLLTMEPPFNEGLSHLLTSAINHLDACHKTAEDVNYSRRLAAFMFKNAVTGVILLDARILVRLVVVFGIQLKDVGEVATPFDADEEKRVQEAKEIVAPFILSLVKDRAYTSAVALLKQFDLQDCTPRDFLATMVTDGEPDLAGQWAAHMGVDMCCYLVQQCTEMGMYKVAHRLVQRYKLENQFPDAYLLYKQRTAGELSLVSGSVTHCDFYVTNWLLEIVQALCSSLRKLAGRGLWDVAESIALTDPVLQEYLVALALEEGDTTQAAELCDRFQMEQIPTCNVIADPAVSVQYVKLSDVMPSDKVFWVDSAESMAFAKEHFRHATIVGLDSEWKANHVKGSQENKVSILQLATAECVFVFDMLQLSVKEPDALDDCLKIVFHAPNVLKLGYAVNNDLERLVHSYQGFECFAVCESLLDLQTFAGRTKGGLTGLTKLAVGGYLDKRARMSDWEKRPLSEKQLQYAALDAAVLMSIFEYLQSAPDSDGNPVTRDYKPFLVFRIPQKKLKKAHPSSAQSIATSGEKSENGEQTGARTLLNDAEEVDNGVMGSSHENSAAVAQIPSEHSDLIVEQEDTDRCELVKGDYLGASAAKDYKLIEPSTGVVDFQSDIYKQKLERLHTSIFDPQLGHRSSDTARNDQAELFWKPSAVKNCVNEGSQQQMTSIGAMNQVVSEDCDAVSKRIDFTSGCEPNFERALEKDYEASHNKSYDLEETAGLVSLFESSVDNEIASAVDDLVSATYELVGQPTPGLLKSKLQEFTQAAGLPLPLYQAESQGPDHLPSFRCAVEVGGMRFWGNTAFKKRDAELLAAQTALSFFQAESLIHANQQIDDNVPSWMRSRIRVKPPIRVDKGCVLTKGHNPYGGSHPLNISVLTIRTLNCTSPHRQEIGSIAVF